MARKSKNNILGQKICAIRDMTQSEMDGQGWSQPATVLVLENGAKIFASCDEEGNDRGELFLTDIKGKHYMLYIPKDKGVNPDADSCKA